MYSVLGEIYFHEQNMCGSLSAIISHNLIGTGNIRRYAFFGVGMTLLEEVCHFGGGV